MNAVSKLRMIWNQDQENQTLKTVRFGYWIMVKIEDIFFLDFDQTLILQCNVLIPGRVTEISLKDGMKSA